MLVALSAAQWVVGKALAPLANGLLEVWDASKNLGLNIEALRMELLLVQATLETASRKHIEGQVMEELLGKLRHSAHCAEDLLDEVDYFRIHDELHGTYDTADQHAKGCFHDLALNARHTTKVVFGRSRARQRSRGNSSSSANANHVGQDEVSGCMPELGKLLPCSSSTHVHDDNSGTSTHCGAPQRETPMAGFNRIDVSGRMKHIVEKLQPLRREVAKILKCCDHIIVPDIAQSRPITTGQIREPEFHGRDGIMNTIIHDMTKGKYHNKDLTVLPIVGPGGIGKTTLMEHIYCNKEVQNHFQVVIWVCVSLNFSLNKLLEDIQKYAPLVEGENGGRPEELIEQRLKSKRFLLVLDDIWEFSNEDDWERLLFPLKTSQEKGSMIIVTTRFPAVAKMVGTTDHSINLEGLESKYFRELFHAFIFVDGQCIRDHIFLLEITDKIMIKLKGSPLAAKTVGRLLGDDLTLFHWRRVLESKEWERQRGINDIIPALKLSYDYLPFHLQQCFFYSALFPEDFHFSSNQLINLWIGLDILQSGSRNQTFEDIGLRNLNDLIKYGFFKEVGTDGHMCYVMHDLLHDLALEIASHECICIQHSNVGSRETQSSIRNLSIVIEDDDIVSHEKFKCQLRKLKTKLKINQLRTLMVFGEIDESLANILGNLFKEASALRVLHLGSMASSVESILHNFSALLHLRYLCMGTKYGRVMQLPITISRFYHLRILDIVSWYGYPDLPRDLSNLAKLCHFYIPSGELHSDIFNVGKLKLLRELKVFKVKKEIEGFEPKELEHLNDLMELGIYNLENIHTKEEADKAKLIEKDHLERLTLDWDSSRLNILPGVEEVVLESLQPHWYLQELCIRGHGCFYCPTWLGDKLTVEVLQSLHLSGVSWKCLPPLGKMPDLRTLVLENISTMKEFVIEQTFCMLRRLELVGMRNFEKWVPSKDIHHLFPNLQVLIIRDCPKLLGMPFSNCDVYIKQAQHWNIDWFPKLQELEIQNCPEFLLVAHIPWTKTLHRVYISDVQLLEILEYYSRSSYLSIIGKDELQSLDQVLAFDKLKGLESLAIKNCPPLELKNLLMLTSLKDLDAHGVIAAFGGEGDVEWQHPIQRLVARKSRGATETELTKLLTHLSRLSQLNIIKYNTITHLAVGEDLQQTTSTTSEVGQEKEDGLLLLPTHLSNSLRDLHIKSCPKLVLVDLPPTSHPAGGVGFQALQSLQRLQIYESPKILSACPFKCYIFPSSLQVLDLNGVEGLETLAPLSNLTSLTKLNLWGCGEDLSCEGIGPLLTAGGQLRELDVRGSPRFFAGWDPNPRQLLQDEGGEEQELHEPVSTPSSSKLHCLTMDEATGLLATPICSFLSTSLIHLRLHESHMTERFTKEQEDALHLPAGLQQLEFSYGGKLQYLPAGLHKFTNLKLLHVYSCPAVRSLPMDGFPKSLQELDVSFCKKRGAKKTMQGVSGNHLENQTTMWRLI